MRGLGLHLLVYSAIMFIYLGKYGINRAPDKRSNEDNLKIIFLISQFKEKTYIVTPH